MKNPLETWKTTEWLVNAVLMSDNNDTTSQFGALPFTPCKEGFCKIVHLHQLNEVCGEEVHSLWQDYGSATIPRVHKFIHNKLLTLDDHLKAFHERAGDLIHKSHELMP